MNPELPNNPREELELRVTALLLGELSADEAAAVREAVAKDPELSRLHDDLKQTIHIVRQAMANAGEPVIEQGAQPTLSEARRKKLLTHFAIPPLKETDRKPKPLFRLGLVEWAAVFAIIAAIAAIAVAPLGVSRREKGQVSTTTEETVIRVAADAGLERARANMVEKMLGVSGPGSNNVYSLNVVGYQNSPNTDLRSVTPGAAAGVPPASQPSTSVILPMARGSVEQAGTPLATPPPEAGVAALISTSPVLTSRYAYITLPSLASTGGDGNAKDETLRESRSTSLFVSGPESIGLLRRNGRDAISTKESPVSQNGFMSGNADIADRNTNSWAGTFGGGANVAEGSQGGGGAGGGDADRSRSLARTDSHNVPTDAFTTLGDDAVAFDLASPTRPVIDLRSQLLLDQDRAARSATLNLPFIDPATGLPFDTLSTESAAMNEGKRGEERQVFRERYGLGVRAGDGRSRAGDDVATKGTSATPPPAPVASVAPAEEVAASPTPAAPVALNADAPAQSPPSVALGESLPVVSAPADLATKKVPVLGDLANAGTFYRSVVLPEGGASGGSHPAKPTDDALGLHYYLGRSLALAPTELERKNAQPADQLLADGLRIAPEGKDRLAESRKLGWADGTAQEFGQSKLQDAFRNSNPPPKMDQGPVNLGEEINRPASEINIAGYIGDPAKPLESFGAVVLPAAPEDNKQLADTKKPMLAAVPSRPLRMSVIESAGERGTLEKKIASVQQETQGQRNKLDSSSGFRAGLTQTDVLQAGRLASDMITRELDGSNVEKSQPYDEKRELTESAIQPEVGLESRTFRVDPKLFGQELESIALSADGESNSDLSGIGAVGIPRVNIAGGTGGGRGDDVSGVRFLIRTNNMEELHERIRRFFSAMGVELNTNGKSVFFNDRTGNLLINAQSEDLDRIAAITQSLMPTQSVTNSEARLANAGNRSSVKRKLDQIKLKSVFSDGLPLSEIVRNLSEETKKHDPEKKGINFILKPNADAAAAAPIDPTTGLPVALAPGQPVDISDVSIMINPALNDVRLAQVLDVITKVSDRPLKYSIEDYGIVFSEDTSKDRPVPRPAAPAPIPQPEIQTSENNFSTFSLNVSDVSFKLAAASLEKGQMPDAVSVRSEEFINAFDYRDPEPAAGAPIAFAWERVRYPFAHNRDLLRFSLKTAAAGRQAGRPLNIVLLLDNSGSMERADRVSIIREALRVLASQLQPQDKLSVITFARTARLVADGISGDKAGEVAEQVSGLTPQGGTNLEDAMNLAYQTAARHYLANGINRVVLLTDGAANLGNVEPDSLKQKVEAQRKQGIALDCFGIGWEGLNDDLLEVLSRNGDGRYGFINSPEEAATDFASQLAGALKVAASDVKVQVEFNPKRVTAYRQIGYAKHQLTKEQFRDNTVDAAEIAAQEAGNALYTVEVNPAGEGPLGTVRVRYKIPGTTDYREQAWDVPYTGNAASLEQSSPAMRLAATASAFSEWLVASPFAGEVTPDRLLGYLSGVPEVYGADSRPKKLEWMIRQTKSIAGKQ